METFSNELRCVQRNQSLPSNSNLLGLAPILDSDCLPRFGGRTGRAKLPYDQLHLPLLPGKHLITPKIIRTFHEYSKHVGIDFLLPYIRQTFWITCGRKVVKRVRRDCPVCRRYHAKPGKQIMGDLPESRLDTGSFPFTRIADDLFESFEVGLPCNRIA